MTIPKYEDIILLSNVEISNIIIETEKELFNLRFKKATGQSFKSHKIKQIRRRLANLKTILSLKLKLE